MSYHRSFITFAKKKVMITFNNATHIRLEETGSTNSVLLEMVKKEHLPEGTIVSAGYQTAGRGMGSNSWTSEKGKNATFSLLLYPSFIKAEDQFIITQLISVGIMNWVKSLLPGCDVVIKWPNDILVNRKKICGILAQSSILGDRLQYIIAGIGINLNQSNFGELDQFATSVLCESGQQLDVDQSIKEIREKIYDQYTLLAEGYIENIQKEYLRVLHLLNEEHIFMSNQEKFSGTIKGVNRFGQLLITDNHGRSRTYNTKEVLY